MEGIGYNHPTVDVSGQTGEEEQGLRCVDAVVYRHESGELELAGLMYDGALLPGGTALSVYEGVFDKVYGDEVSGNGMDKGLYTWNGVKEVLDR